MSRPQRARSTSLPPTLSTPWELCSVLARGDHDQQQRQSLSSQSLSIRTSTSNGTSNGTFLYQFDIGGIARPQDLLPKDKHNTRGIESLQLHDFAFISTSNGHTWTYAIIAERQEDMIRFVVDTKGRTKILYKKDWATCIRMTNDVKTVIGKCDFSIADQGLREEKETAEETEEEKPGCDPTASLLPCLKLCNRRLPMLPTGAKTCSSNGTFLHQFDIGDAAALQEMPPRKEHNAMDVEALQIHDFAFISTSDGHTWTYAIIAERQEDMIRFVVDKKGRTKKVLRKDWATCIRMTNDVNTDVKTFTGRDGISIVGQRTKEEKETLPEEGTASLILSSKSSTICLRMFSPSTDTSLHQFDIGDVTTLQEMPPRKEHNARGIESLQIHDFAFISSSGGHTWTYAIIAERQEDMIRFVVDKKGRTKKLLRKDWATSIRMF